MTEPHLSPEELAEIRESFDQVSFILSSIRRPSSWFSVIFYQWLVNPWTLLHNLPENRIFY